MKLVAGSFVGKRGRKLKKWPVSDDQFLFVSDPEDF